MSTGVSVASGLVNCGNAATDYYHQQGLDLEAGSQGLILLPPPDHHGHHYLGEEEPGGVSRDPGGVGGGGGGGEGGEEPLRHYGPAYDLKLTRRLDLLHDCSEI